MKTQKRDAASFKKMDDVQIEKIKGGRWLEVTNPDGTISLIWI